MVSWIGVDSLPSFYQGKLLEAQRLSARARYDLELIRESVLGPEVPATLETVPR